MKKTMNVRRMVKRLITNLFFKFVVDSHHPTEISDFCNCIEDEDAITEIAACEAAREYPELITWFFGQENGKEKAEAYLSKKIGGKVYLF